jgi:hypothetical protein
MTNNTIQHAASSAFPRPRQRSRAAFMIAANVAAAAGLMADAGVAHLIPPCRTAWLKLALGLA